MALAIRFDQFIGDWVVAGRAERCRLGHVTRTCLTQVINALDLAADVRGAILFFARTGRSRDQIMERYPRPIAAVLDRQKQWRMRHSQRLY
jgi:hypothetical protein